VKVWTEKRSEKKRPGKSWRRRRGEEEGEIEEYLRVYGCQIKGEQGRPQKLCI
jgi:hypothetical protein